MAKNQILSALNLRIEIGGGNYRFTHVTKVSETDELKRILKISPQGIGNGVIEESGTTAALEFAYTLNEVPYSLIVLLSKAFENGERIVIKEFSAKQGERYGYAKTLSHAIINSSPWVGELSEGATEEIELIVHVARANVKREELT